MNDRSPLDAFRLLEQAYGASWPDNDPSAISGFVLGISGAYAAMLEHEQLVLDDAAVDRWENEGGPGPAEYEAFLEPTEPYATECFHGNGRRHRVWTNIHPVLLDLMIRAAKGEDVRDLATYILGTMELS